MVAGEIGARQQQQRDLVQEREQLIDAMATGLNGESAEAATRLVMIDAQQEVLTRQLELLREELQATEQQAQIAELEALYKRGHEHYTKQAALDEEVRACQERINELIKERRDLEANYQLVRTRRAKLILELQRTMPGFAELDRKLYNLYKVEGYF
jgi:chromosome segregation ATPase